MLRRDTTKFLHGGELCVSTYVNLRWMKVKRFNRYCVTVQAASRPAAPKWSWPRNRAIKCRPLQSWFIILNIMFALLLRNSMKVALRHWNQNLVRVDRQNLLKMTRLSSQTPPSARRTFWAVRSNAGRWKSCVNIWRQKKLFPRSVSKLFALFCTKEKSGSDAPKRGKNAMIRGLSLKKTNPQVCKQARIQWPDNIFRRVWTTGDTSSTGPNLLPYKPSETFACHLSPPSRCSALAGILRCSSEKTVGLFSSSQKTSGSPGSVEAFKEKISEKSTHSFDPGQLLTASQAKSAALLSQKQYPLDLDANQCIMAQSYRMPVYTCEGICYPRNQLSKS